MLEDSSNLPQVRTPKDAVLELNPLSWLPWMMKILGIIHFQWHLRKKRDSDQVGDVAAEYQTNHRS